MPITTKPRSFVRRTPRKRADHDSSLLTFTPGDLVSWVHGESRISGVVVAVVPAQTDLGGPPSEMRRKLASISVPTWARDGFLELTERSLAHLGSGKPREQLGYLVMSCPETTSGRKARLYFPKTETLRKRVGRPRLRSLPVS